MILFIILLSFGGAIFGMWAINAKERCTLFRIIGMALGILANTIALLLALFYPV